MQPLRTCCYLALALSALLSACSGGSSGTATSPPPAQNTALTVLISSTSNDRQSQFTATMANLTLTNQAGHTVNVFSTPQSVEFLHLDGNVAPLLTATVPQDVYVSAAMSISGATYTCVGLDASGGLLSSEYGGSGFTAVVNLAGPIALRGPSSSLVLTLQAAQSAIFASCNTMYTAQGDVAATTAITPTFTLAPAILANAPTSSSNGLATDLAGFIISIDSAASQIGVTSEDGLAWSIRTNATTVFQGAANLAALAVGMPVLLDISVAADGSLAAGRIAVPDANPTTLSTFHGPVAQVGASSPVIYLGPLMVEGQYSSVVSLTTTSTTSGWDFDVGSATYQTSSRLTNLSGLPFTASFNATNIVPGQSVFVSNHQLYFTGANRDPATTITLVPQTIDGTVVGTSSSGGFTIYTVALAAYDVFSSLAVQPGQTTLLQNPTTVFVYADANTQMLNATPVAAGSVLRFNGLVFNDNGTLRMDCSAVLDGVPL